ncbi:MAG TPA: DNA/RNA non-specific endonuclease [Longimicrobiaceae bacterium]|nr:DNA/RNA non-specific endonuclease [Longimicrobiaceae bacterium]
MDPVDPAAGAAAHVVLSPVDCVASVRSGAVSCGAAATGAAGVHGDVMLGGQGTLVRLASANTAYDGDSEVFSTDVTVQNLLAQAMGTTDGVTVAPGGIRIFFSGAPRATSGSGTVAVLNADGTDTFLGPDQPFFEYDQKLDSGAVSVAHPWRFSVPASVGSFTFRVYVATPVKPLLVINEIMADPAVIADSVGEWLEIYNRGIEAVDLGGWKLASANDALQTVASGVTIPAGGYVVFGKSRDAARNGGAAVAWSFGALNLANSTTDWVALRSPAGVTADSVIWGVAPTSGRSRGVINGAADNTTSSGTNWALATTTYGSTTNQGTPGAANDGSAAPAPTAGPARTLVVTPDSFGLTVGATRQMSWTARDSAGQATSATVTWSTTSAGIATVSSTGLVTGQGVGNALIIALATTGAADTARVRVDTAATTTGSSVYLNHLEFGRPTDADTTNELFVRHTEYVLSYSRKHGGPNWVAWDLNATHFGGAARCNCFAADPTLPDSMYHVVTSDYTGSGYSRGHMVMSAERTASALENAHAFYMTNILPQYQDMNGGPWELFENYANDLATSQNKEVYIVAGGLWTASPATLNNAGKVEIPTHTWKIMVIVPRGTGLANVHSTADLQVVAVMMPNVTGILGQPWEGYRTTVDAIEAATGYDFLALLPDSIENAVEAN